MAMQCRPFYALATAIAGTAASEPLGLANRAEELRKLRWGMFICWSLSTFSGHEWTPGITNIDLFAAKGCDTDEWARTAKEAQMGYILFLTKHHDAFCLWDTATTDRKVTKAPLGLDVLAKLRKSCDKYGIKLALYHSEGEWRWPGGLDDPATPAPKKTNQGGSNPEMKKAQLRELLTQYGPIEYIWFDHAVGDGGLGHRETVEWCHRWQSRTLIGFNHGEAAGEISLREMGTPGPLGDAKAGSYNQSNEEQYHGYQLAEFTYPILPKHEGGADWFYSLPVHDHLCRPAEQIYADYLGAVKYGNIFSLDVGPDYNGKLRRIDVETLRRVGQYIRGEIQPSTIQASAPAAFNRRNNS